MTDILHFLFNSKEFMAHGFCFLWRPELLWTLVISDIAIALSYFSIPLAIFYYMLKRKDVEYKWVFILFILFILSCGLTHLLAVIVIWKPVYGISAAIKAITAVISVATAIVLWPLIPKALNIPSRAYLLDLNHKLELEINQHKKTQAQLRKLTENLDKKGETRTHALKISEERYALAQRGANIGSWDWDIVSGTLQWSEQIESMFGLEAGMFENTFDAFLKLVYPEDQQLVVDACNDAVNNGKECDIEHRIVWPDGTVRWVSEQGDKVCNEKGKAVHMLGIVQDITERKKMEEQLVYNHMLVNAVLEGITDAIYIKDCEGRYILVNPATCLALGKSEEDIIGKDDAALFPAESAEIINQVDTKVFITGQETQTEEKLTTAYGEETYWLSNKAPFYDKNKKIIGIMGISRNITDIKASEKEKESLQSRLNQAQKMEAIGSLAGGVAHDFNNILAILQGNLDILNRELKHDEKLLKRTETALKGISRAANITQKLLKFSRPKTTSSQVISINRTISDMGWLIEKSVMKSIDIKLELGSDLWLTEINEGDFQDALLNLVLNAKDAMAGVEAGKIVIETVNKVLDLEEIKSNHYVEAEVEGEYVLFSIRDCGCGISKEEIGHVFEPFFTTKTIGKGTGLGLSMVYGFVKRSNGHIQLHSEPGQGTIVKIYFPRSVKGEGEQQEWKANDSVIPKGRETILIVDDEEELLELASYHLKALGYKVRTAVNGPDALSILSKDDGKIDLLFSDIIMPGGMDGFALAKQVMEQYSGIKALLTSGYTDKPDKLNKLAKYKVKLLEKPYSKEGLAKQIRDVLDGDT